MDAFISRGTGIDDWYRVEFINNIKSKRKYTIDNMDLANSVPTKRNTDMINIIFIFKD